MLLAIFAQLSAAHACSVLCADPIDAGLHLPADGEVDVPVDATPFVGGVAESLVVLGADDVAVEVEAVLRDGLVQLVPATELLPDTKYVVIDGETELGSFVTGSDRSRTVPLEPPERPTAVGHIERDLRPGHNLGAACGGLGEGVWLDVAWPETTGVYEVQVTRPSGEVIDLVRASELTSLGWTVPCNDTVPDLAPDEVLEIRVRSVGHAGGVSDWSAPLVTSVRGAGGGCDTSGGHAAWLLVGLASLGLRRAHT